MWDIQTITEDFIPPYIHSPLHFFPFIEMSLAGSAMNVVVMLAVLLSP